MRGVVDRVLQAGQLGFAIVRPGGLVLVNGGIVRDGLYSHGWHRKGRAAMRANTSGASSGTAPPSWLSAASTKRCSPPTGENHRASRRVAGWGPRSHWLLMLRPWLVTA